ncbi:MAG: DUF4012 domain-containing protein [Microgenomates group bacterium]
MTSRTYTIETRGQGVVVLGGPADLRSGIISELNKLGLKTISPANHVEIESLRDTHDLDVVLVFPDYDQKKFEPIIKSLVSTGESKLVSISHILSNSSAFLPNAFKTIKYSDYVGPSEYQSDILERWISSIQSRKTIEISGDGLSEVSFLGISDLAHLVALAVLSPAARAGESYILANPVGISLLNLAYLIRTSLPFKINLNFTSEEGAGETVLDTMRSEASLEQLKFQLLENPETYIKNFARSLTITTEDEKVVSPVVPPVAQLKELQAPLKKLTPLKYSQAIFVPLQNHRPSRIIKKAGPPSIRTVIVRGLFIAIALYLGTLAFTSTISLLSLRNISKVISQGELPTPNKLNSFCVTYLRANLVALTTVTGLSHTASASSANLLMDAYVQSLSIFDTATKLNKSTSSLSKYVFGSGEGDGAQIISLSRLQAEELYQKLSLLDGQLPQTAPNIIPARYQDSYKTTKSKLASIKRTITTMRAVLASTPDLIGLSGRRKYGVLFQNNMELRATGGFIGSFAILTFENGKLYDMPIYDVYDADGQLKGHVDPPRPIKDILGEANWYLRDSNFDPDYPTSARRAEWFIKKTLNQDLDGTIAVNINTLSGLLSATGPLKISDYDETITPDNLYERAQSHAEVNFFPGSTQKKEFLSTVANTLFAKLPSLGGGEGIKLMSALATSIEEKDTLISVLNPVPEHIFETLGWNGKILDLPCPSTQGCYKDYVMVVDSNFGVNKANFYLKRNLEEIITLDKNLSVSHVLRITLNNTAPSASWPAGTYKNYERIYLPPATSISSIKIDGKSLGENDYTTTNEHSKTALAYLVTVPIASKSLVEIEYLTPQINQGDAPLYSWYWQKQPGTSRDDPLTVYLNFPLYLKPSVISPDGQLSPQQLKFNLTNDTDHRITVKFSK